MQEDKRTYIQFYLNYSTFKIIPLFYFAVPKLESTAILPPRFYFEERPLLFNVTEH